MGLYLKINDGTCRTSSALRTRLTRGESGRNGTKNTKYGSIWALDCFSFLLSSHSSASLRGSDHELHSTLPVLPLHQHHAKKILGFLLTQKERPQMHPPATGRTVITRRPKIGTC